MGRSVSLAYGIICYVVFFITFLYAIGFTGNFIVPKGIDTGPPVPLTEAVIINIVLMGLFAVQHSVMARPAFKRWWTRFVSASVERSTYVLFASLLLLLLFWQWRPIAEPVWSVAAPFWRTVLWGGFIAGWAIVLLSTFMIGHFDLFGLKQVLLNWRGETPPAPAFKEPGFYKLVRHPIMVGFIIAFWATPDMTVGHALFAAVTTAYILIAVHLEERDLMAVLGSAYTAYRNRVPAFIPFTKKGRASEGGRPETPPGGAST